MRARWVMFIVCASAVAFVLPSTAVTAAPSPPPVILAAVWLTAPVGVGHSEVLQVSAVDPSDVIKEVVVEWGDGVVSFAGLRCSGGVATTRLAHEYNRAGAYVVSIVARSAPRCPLSPRQQSVPFLLPTLAR